MAFALAPSSPWSLSWCWASLFLPTTLFFVLDTKLTSSSWDWQGEYSTMLSSTEPQQVGRFILRRWNTYSSHAHTTAGAYVLVRSTDTKGPVSSVLFGASLLVLSLLSHAWWASRRRLACHVDNLFMEAHIVALSLVIVSPALPPAYESWLVLATVAATLLRGVTFSGEAALFPCVALLVGSSLYAVRSLGGSGQLELFAAGLALALAGVVFKLADASGDGCWWGTAVFHYMEAAGFTTLFLWAQTLPAQI